MQRFCILKAALVAIFYTNYMGQMIMRNVKGVAHSDREFFQFYRAF